MVALRLFDRIARAARLGSLASSFGAMLLAASAWAIEPIPERLVVLTFDDSTKSHFTVARPLLKKYKFGATFFVTEGLTYNKNRSAYMTWDEIRTLHEDGFEIGNHTRDHMAVNQQNTPQLAEQLRGIDQQCKRHGIPKPVSFAWPACFLHRDALPVLRKHGIVWARRCSFPEFPPQVHRGIAYEPGLDDPLLIPTAGMSRPDWTLEHLRAALALPKKGHIVVLTFHGVPETEHPWVDTPRERFEEFMKHLYEHDYKVIAVRDLARFVDPQERPKDAWAIINQRREAAKRQREN